MVTIMPIYEYQCNKCGKTHEFWQKVSEAPVKECPDCGGLLHKLVSLSSFQLKGGGWSIDGYSSSNPTNQNCSTKKDSSTKTETRQSTTNTEQKPTS